MKTIITKPPVNCWKEGYLVCKGTHKHSVNKTALYAQNKKILPNQLRLMSSFANLKETLKTAGFKVVMWDFPKELNTNNCLHHDGVFVRDVGLMFKDYWIKANFSATNRQFEAETYAKIINKRFNKQIISLPKTAFIEFGEVYYLETSNGSFYFGGLSRANKEGHDFVKNIIKPDHYYLIESKGYHLDTVFTPVVNTDNKLIAIIIAKEMLEQDSYDNLKNLDIEIVNVNNKDSSDEDGLGNYAINCLAGKGVLIGGSKFTTPLVEERLKKLGIKHYVVSLIDFNLSGGSVHCLTNEIYE
jgi:N-dimethylarginine dimethylaminohydrolase